MLKTLRMKLLFLFLICLPSLLLTEACSLLVGDGINCGDGPKTHSFYMSESDKSKIPFSGTDTLTYKGTNGELALLYGQGLVKKASCESADNMADPGCPDDANCYESISVSYTGDNPHLNRIFLRYIANKYDPAHSTFDLTIGYHTFDEYSLGYLNYSTNYADTVVINSIVYLGRKITIDAPNNYSVIYNYQHGVLKITTSNVEWLKTM
jgi:hypothetical protein